jgi:Cu2+-exporting ATPase
MLRGGEVYFDTAAMIPTLVLVGRFVEASAKGRASEAVARLTRLAPREARRIERGADGREEPRSVPVAEIRPGDRIAVVPGERVALDGTVLEGASEVNESLVTGESQPVAKAPGAAVIGGTVNGTGALIVEVTRVGKDTVLAGIVRAVEEAQGAKPRIQAVADRVVGVFVPAMLVLAAATLVFWLARGAPIDRALMTGISVVVIACPCALGLATPIAVIVSTGLATQRGLLVKGGDVIERAGRATDVLLDKTGTVTRGRPVLREIVLVDTALGRDAVLALVAAVESRSEHHVGRAIAEAARALPELEPIEVEGSGRWWGRGGGGRQVHASTATTTESYEAVHPGPSTSRRPAAPRSRTGSATPRQPSSEGETTSTSTSTSIRPRPLAPRVVPHLISNRALLADHGVALPDADVRARALEARGETVAFLAVNGVLTALFSVADVVRDEAPAAIARLRSLGVWVAIVSGDTQVTTGAVAAGLGIEAIAEATPVEKRAAVARLQAEGRRVLFAGDGINDAPALTQADVGAAMGRGTDVTMESADAVLVRDDLRLLPDLVQLSRRTYAVIRQNLFWAFFYNVIAIPLAMAGVLHPIVAAAAMAASSLFVVLNSLRLRGALG